MNALWGLFILAGLIYGIFFDGTFWKIYLVLIIAYYCFTMWFRNARDNGIRRTIMIATWGAPSDPSAYIVNEYNMTKCLAYVKKLNAGQSEVKVTVTHIIAHSMAWGLYKMRRDIGHLPFGVYKHEKKIGVTSLCDVDGGKDLIPVTIFDGHKMELLEYAAILASKTTRAKTNTDKDHTKGTANFQFLPAFIGQPLLYALTYISMQLGFSCKAIGLRNDQFGHTVLTNVGPLGYKEAFAPLCPIAHTTSLICTGKIEKRPIVNDKGEIEVADMMTACATGDHRYGDAAIFINFFATMRGYLADPENFDPTKYKENIHYTEREANEKAGKQAEKASPQIETTAPSVEKEALLPEKVEEPSEKAPEQKLIE